MPVLEITLLRILPPHIPGSPVVLFTLDAVRTALREKVHNTRSRFYTFSEDPFLVFIFGAWNTVSQHDAFLADSKTRKEVLGEQESVFAFVWGTHSDQPLPTGNRVHLRKAGEVARVEEQDFAGDGVKFEAIWQAATPNERQEWDLVDMEV